MNRYFVRASIAAFFLLSGCSSTHHHDDQTGQNSQTGPTRMLFSPNGEPLNGGPLGRPTCEDAMTHWFDRVDTNHDGFISQDEFIADAQIQFQRMDIDKNGYLLAEELDRFRLPYQQESANSTSAKNADSNDEQKSDHSAGKHGGSSNSSHSSDTSSSDQLDPVMSADTKNEFKVTPDEFMTQAHNVFAGLDTEHNGLLSRKEVLTSCEDKHH